MISLVEIIILVFIACFVVLNSVNFKVILLRYKYSISISLLPQGNRYLEVLNGGFKFKTKIER